MKLGFAPKFALQSAKRSPIKYFAARRRRNLSLLVGFALAAVVANALLSASLRVAPYWSGWLLLLLIVGLALYGLRRRLPTLPLGSSAVWLQLHIYGGLFSSVAFLLHTGIHLPTGRFELLLATIFLLVFSSGLLGLLVSRIFARRLTARGSEVVYERIGVYRQRLQFEVEEIVSRLVGDAGAVAVSDFYEDRLRAYFERLQHFLQHLVGSTKPGQQLVRDIDAYCQYLNEDERTAMREIADRVIKKADLDYHYALQYVLKHWPFIHVPLTYSLLLLSFVHVLLVHAFD